VSTILLFLLTDWNHDYKFQLKLAMTKSIPDISNSRCKISTYNRPRRSRGGV